MTLQRTFATGTAAVLIGLALPARAQIVDTVTTKASLIAADTSLARKLIASGPEALIALLDSNAAVLIPDNPILRGPAKAGPALRKRYGGSSRYTWHVMHAVASTDGKFGCTVGIIRFLDGLDSTAKERGGVYEACWQRTAQGQWQIVGLQSNDDTGPGRSLLYLVGTPLHRAPHSATVAVGDKAVAEALDTDTDFASMAAGNRGPLPAFVKYAATDAISMIAPDSARGHVEIANLFGGMEGQFALLWNPDRSYGAGSGGLAFTVGRSVRIPLKGQRAPERHGKFLTVWRQNADGTWSWIFDLGSLRRWQPD